MAGTMVTKSWCDHDKGESVKRGGNRPKDRPGTVALWEVCKYQQKFSSPNQRAAICDTLFHALVDRSFKKLTETVKNTLT